MHDRGVQTSMENYEEALQDCKKAISFDPEYSKAYSRMGLIYSKINLFAESENCYEKALKLEPDNDSYKKNIQVRGWQQVAQEAKELFLDRKGQTEGTGS